MPSTYPQLTAGVWAAAGTESARASTKPTRRWSTTGVSHGRCAMCDEIVIRAMAQSVRRRIREGLPTLETYPPQPKQDTSLPPRECDTCRVSHLTACHHVPMQVEDILERRAGVRREAEAFDACVPRDPRGGENEFTHQTDIGELGDGSDMAARDNEHVKGCRGGLCVESDDVRVLEANRRWRLVSGDPAEDTVDRRLVQWHLTRDS